MRAREEETHQEEDEPPQEIKIPLLTTLHVQCIHQAPTNGASAFSIPIIDPLEVEDTHVAEDEAEEEAVAVDVAEEITSRIIITTLMKEKILQKTI